jgi:hypothetical protein
MQSSLSELHFFGRLGVRNQQGVALNRLWIARDRRAARLITWWGGEVGDRLPSAAGEGG